MTEKCVTASVHFILGKDTKRASEALTPIREMTSEDEDTLTKKMSQMSFSQARDLKASDKEEVMVRE